MDDHVHFFPSIEFVQEFKTIIDVNLKHIVHAFDKVPSDKSLGTSNNIHSKILSNIYSTIPKYKKGALIVSQT